jgi:heat shock protein HslJ
MRRAYFVTTNHAATCSRLDVLRAVFPTLVALLTLGLAVACGGDDEEGSADDSSLEGVPWVLASGLDVEGWEGVAPSATFADGTVGGSTGCNRYTATYTLDGDELEIGPIAATRMACIPPADAVERAYLAALERVTGWRVEDDELTLVDEEDADVLRFAAATLVGDWNATAFQSGDAVLSVIAGTEVTASFGEDGTLSGSSGCNTYRATYEADRGQIEISAPAGTKKACAEPAGAMEQEAAYLAGLPTAVRYRVDGRSLTLERADGTIFATYTRAEPESSALPADGVRTIGEDRWRRDSRPSSIERPTALSPSTSSSNR